MLFIVVTNNTLKLFINCTNLRIFICSYCECIYFCDYEKHNFRNNKIEKKIYFYEQSIKVFILINTIRFKTKFVWIMHNLNVLIQRGTRIIARDFLEIQDRLPRQETLQGRYSCQFSPKLFPRMFHTILWVLMNLTTWATLRKKVPLVLFIKILIFLFFECVPF